VPLTGADQAAHQAPETASGAIFDMPPQAPPLTLRATPTAPASPQPEVQPDCQASWLP
jgi:hypothetical protein